MNVEPGPGRPPLDHEVWLHQEMRNALARRDLAEVFRRLGRVGVSQRAIATMTGMSASEVYEVLRGRRVMAYDVLCRVGDGLGLPRGWLGLAYDPDTELFADVADVPVPRSGEGPSVAEQAEVRALLAHAASVTMGVADPLTGTSWQAWMVSSTPAPSRIGHPDVEKLELLIAALRRIDYAHGGGACREAVVAQTRWITSLMRARAADDVRARLHLALADVHNLAGWTSMDVGLHTAARSHFAQALVNARSGQDASLVANVLYRTGRLHLHIGMTHEALRFFQLGQIAAQDAGCPLTVAMLCANEAWAYAVLGDAGQAAGSLQRSADELSRADPSRAAPWVRFFGEVDLGALTGMVHLELSVADRRRAETAREALGTALAARTDDMARSRAFEQTALATAAFRDGDLEEGVRIGRSAAAIAASLRSARVSDRLKPLVVASRAASARSSDAAELAEVLVGQIAG